jgi:hypothetical protein
MNIVLFDCYNVGYDVAIVCQPNKELYCAKHGYVFRSFTFSLGERTVHWGRVKGISAVLPEFDWLLYLDCDTVITNSAIRIEDFIDQDFDLMIGRMPSSLHLSTSGLLLRNCEWSFRMLDCWWQTHVDEYHSDSDTTRGGGRFFDQSGFHKMYDDNHWVRSRTKILPGKNFNNEAWTWEKSDFLLHCQRRLKTA